MKRNKELIREILLYAEEWNSAGSPRITPDILTEHFHREREISAADFRLHCQMIIDKQLVKGTLFENGIVVSSITWDGYEFIDNARNSKVWQAAKKVSLLRNFE